MICRRNIDEIQQKLLNRFWAYKISSILNHERNPLNVSGKSKFEIQISSEMKDQSHFEADMIASTLLYIV